jgi:hypothetical protein
MLKKQNDQEALIGLVMTIIISFLKNHFSNKNSNLRVLLTSGIAWAAHYLVRKYIMNNLKTQQIKKE